MNPASFPIVSGKNLHRKTFRLPRDFPAKYTLVLMAFWRHHQQDIDTWLPFAEKLDETYRNVSYLELPVIYKMGIIRQFMLNEGMRAGVLNNTAREKTITLYVNKPRFLKQLNIPSEEEIQIFLSDLNGVILWRETGVFSPDKEKSLNHFIQTSQLELKGGQRK